MGMLNLDGYETVDMGKSFCSIEEYKILRSVFKDSGFKNTVLFSENGETLFGNEIIGEKRFLVNPDLKDFIDYNKTSINLLLDNVRQVISSGNKAKNSDQERIVKILSVFEDKKPESEVVELLKYK